MAIVPISNSSSVVRKTGFGRSAMTPTIVQRAIASHFRLTRLGVWEDFSKGSGLSMTILKLLTLH
jgi:hypothetical protein